MLLGVSLEMRCKIVLLAAFLFFSFQSVTIAGSVRENSRLFATSFLDQFLSLDKGADSRDLDHLFRHPVSLLNRKHRSVIYQGSVEDIYRQKRGGEDYHEIWHKDNRVSAILPLQQSFLKANLAVCLVDERFRLRIRSGQRYNLDFNREKSFAQFVFARRLFPGFFEIGIGTKTLEVSQKRFWDYSCEVTFSPFDRMKFGLAHRNLNINYFLELQYEGNLMDLPVNWASEENEWYFDLGLLSGMQFSLSCQNTSLKENRRLFRQSDFFLSPGGDVFTFCSRLNLRLSPVFQIHFGRKKNHLESRGDFYYLNQKFAKTTSVEMTREGTFGGVSFDVKQRHFFSTQVEVIEISGEGKGHIETWPFTSTLEDLLGQRFYFRLNGEAQILRLGLEYHSPRFRLLSLNTRGSIDYLSVRPSGKAATWNPIFLVFGIKNLKTYSLKYQRIDGVILRLGFSRTFKHLSFCCNLLQFVPVHTKTKKTGEERPNENAPANFIQKSSRGGTTCLFSVSYQLP
jgi:predicted metal-binding transcription factor (methanogenesis marker protein 9)